MLEVVVVVVVVVARTTTTAAASSPSRPLLLPRSQGPGEQACARGRRSRGGRDLLPPARRRPAPCLRAKGGLSLVVALFFLLWFVSRSARQEATRV